MSARYCVLLDGRANQPRPLDEAPSRRGPLRRIFSRHAVDILADATTPWTPLPNGGGIILGTVFAGSDPHRSGTQALLRIPESGDLTRWMVENIWGRYLAVVVGNDGRSVDILRDPIGLFPCYRADHGGSIAFSGDARTLHSLGMITGAIDWGAAALPLAYPDLRVPQTGLVGVVEPPPGDVIHWRDGVGHKKTVWSPAHFCQTTCVPEFDNAVRAVRSSVDDVMAAWSGSANRLLLSLSGGLDSSIIATAVAEPAARLTAFNLRSGRGRGDERDHARMVAGAVGIPLHEYDISRASVDLGRSLAADLPRASARAFTQPVDRLAGELADEIGADAHISGGGGDNVFAFLHSANPAADRLRAEGPKLGFIRTVLDVAELTGCTIPHVARRAIAKAWRAPNRYDWPHSPELLAPDYRTSVLTPHHPWFADEQSLRPGQRQHVASISRAAYLTGFLNIADDRPTIYPLLSQPLVELCLGIPTWLCCRGGRDRAVARAAFADRIPASILARRSKGAFEGLIGTIYETQRTLIRQMILDGGLVRNGILSRADAERALDARFAEGSYSARLLQCIDVEAWAASWGG